MSQDEDSKSKEKRKIARNFVWEVVLIISISGFLLFATDCLLRNNFSGLVIKVSIFIVSIYFIKQREILWIEKLKELKEVSKD